MQAFDFSGIISVSISSGAFEIQQSTQNNILGNLDSLKALSYTHVSDISLVLKNCMATGMFLALQAYRRMNSGL